MLLIQIIKEQLEQTRQIYLNWIENGVGSVVLDEKPGNWTNGIKVRP